jgi:hypothetical protein
MVEHHRGNGPAPSGTSQKPADSRPSLEYDVRHRSYGTRLAGSPATGRSSRSTRRQIHHRRQQEEVQPATLAASWWLFVVADRG